MWHPMYSVTQEQFGHPLACGIWRDAVCTCDPTRPAVASGCKHDPPCGVEDCEFDEVGEERHDTEPAQPIGKRCYFCGESACTVVYCAGIPSCLQCAERAASKKAKCLPVAAGARDLCSMEKFACQ